MSEYLTRAELYDLTERKTGPAQIAWLRARRWRWEPDADGRPKVLKAYRDKRMLDARRPAEESPEPNFAALG